MWCGRIHRWFSYLGDPLDVPLGLFDKHRAAAMDLEAIERGEPMDMISQALRNAPGAKRQ